MGFFLLVAGVGMGAGEAATITVIGTIRVTDFHISIPSATGQITIPSATGHIEHG